jgi:hypothetical protein
MSFLRKIEHSLDNRLRGIFGGRRDEPGSREAIELYRDALDQIAARATVGKRGEHVFPFNRIHIELRAADSERRTVLEALFEPAQLLEDIRSTLAGERAASPEGLAVDVHYNSEAEMDLAIRCEKIEAPAPAPPEPPPTPKQFAVIPVILRTLTGQCSESVFLADKLHISIGREHEVTDAQGRAVRRNDLFFPEGGGDINATVSRTHAHIRFDTATGEWRIYDDGSTLGTYLFRSGRRIDVPAHAPRGVMLLPNDEIYLGQARLRLEIL